MATSSTRKLYGLVLRVTRNYGSHGKHSYAKYSNCRTELNHLWRRWIAAAFTWSQNMHIDSPQATTAATSGASAAAATSISRSGGQRIDPPLDRRPVVDLADLAFMRDKVLTHSTGIENKGSICAGGLIPRGASPGDDKLTSARKSSVYFVKGSGNAGSRTQWVSRWIIPPNMYSDLKSDETGLASSVRYEGIVPARFMISSSAESNSPGGAAGSTKAWLELTGRKISLEESKALLKEI